MGEWSFRSTSTSEHFCLEVWKWETPLLEIFLGTSSTETFSWKTGGTSPERSFPENFLGRTPSEKNSCGRKFSLKREKCHFTEMRGQRLQWNFGLWASEHLVHKKNFLVANFLIKNVFPKENARIGETSKSCPFEKLATIPRVNYFRPETEME